MRCDRWRWVSDGLSWSNFHSCSWPQEPICIPLSSLARVSRTSLRKSVSVSPEASNPFSTEFKSCQINCWAWAHPTRVSESRSSAQQPTKGNRHLFRRIARNDNQRGVVEISIREDVVKVEGSYTLYLRSAPSFCWEALLRTFNKGQPVSLNHATSFV